MAAVRLKFADRDGVDLGRGGVRRVGVYEDPTAETLVGGAQAFGENELPSGRDNPVSNSPPSTGEMVKSQ